MAKHGRLALVCALLLVTLFFTPVPARAQADSRQDIHTIVWMSDTQHLASSRQQIYASMTRWIVNNRKSKNIRYVIHTGDIVHSAKLETQWKNADDAMKALDGVVPYGVLPGNHDGYARKEGYFKTYFGAWRFTDQNTYGGDYKNNWGHYDLLEMGGQQFIMLYLGYGMDSEGIAWANKTLAHYRQRTAFLCVHSYLNTDGTLTSDGRTLFDKVVKPNPNVLYVLCGHKHGVAYSYTEIDDSGVMRTVHQMLCNYQARADGGAGRLRILTLDFSKDIISLRTFSPVVNLGDDLDTLTIPLETVA